MSELFGRMSDLIGTCDPMPKTWGWSTRLFCNDQLQVERIYVRPGGYSSVHMHERKVNQFVVSSGQLSIHTFDESLRRIDTLELTDLTDLTIRTLSRHQFVARSEVQGYEVYWPDCDAPLDPNDIVRFSQNGLDSSWTRRQPDSEYACCCICNRTQKTREMIVVCLENALRTMCKECVNGTSAKPFNQEGTHVDR